MSKNQKWALELVDELRETVTKLRDAEIDPLEILIADSPFRRACINAGFMPPDEPISEHATRPILQRAARGSRKAEIRRLFDSGLTQAEIAEKLQIFRSQVSFSLKG